MFSKPINTLFPLLIALVLLASCSPYQKALKSEDTGVKYAMADSLYKAGKFSKSLKLWEQIIPTYRGKPQAERVQFLYADSYYQVGDYYLAGYQFDRFVTSYPASDKVEEARFKAANSNYDLSPRYSLDQSETLKALDKLQEFLNDYPESQYSETASLKITELSNKMEKKYLEIAKQYNKIMKYPVALSALDDFISDYPGTPFREEAFFYKLDSQYKYAVGSFDYLVQDRLREAIEMYNTLVRYYPEGDFKEQADEIKADIDKRLQNIS